MDVTHFKRDLRSTVSVSLTLLAVNSVAMTVYRIFPSQHSSGQHVGVHGQALDSQPQKLRAKIHLFHCKVRSRFVVRFKKDTVDE